MGARPEEVELLESLGELFPAAANPDYICLITLCSPSLFYKTKFGLLWPVSATESVFPVITGVLANWKSRHESLAIDCFLNLSWA